MGGMQADGKVQCQKEVSTRKNGGASLGPAGVGLVRWMTLIGKLERLEKGAEVLFQGLCWDNIWSLPGAADGKQNERKALILT